MQEVRGGKSIGTEITARDFRKCEYISRVRLSSFLEIPENAVIYSAAEISEILRANAQKNRLKCKNRGHGQKRN